MYYNQINHNAPYYDINDEPIHIFYNTINIMLIYYKIQKGFNNCVCIFFFWWEAYKII